MAKIAFIQDTLFDYFGPMSLSAVLKEQGHQVEIFILKEEKKIISSIKKLNPDLIAFSVVSGFHKWNLRAAQQLKRYFSVPFIFGGPHPTFFRDVINEEAVDMICIGEGEVPMLELANRIDKNEDYSDIEGLWVKKEGQIIKNPLGNLVEDLDSFPFPDRELYYSKFPFLRGLVTKRFATSRGCPYNCSFCYNHAKRLLYKGKGKYVRRMSPARIIEEIKSVQEKYPLEVVRFIDDNFTVDKRWLMELFDLYHQEIGLPFTCLGRANELNEEVVKKLSWAGCDCITFGLETANENMRNLLLRKALKNESIIEGVELLRKYKIKVGTYNMIGLPGETIEEAIETMKFNAKIKTDYTLPCIFQPYPKTDLAEYCVENGYIGKEFNVDVIPSLFDSSLLKSEYADQFANLQKFFSLGAKYPSTIPLIRKLIKLKPNRIFYVVGVVSYGIRSLSSFKIGLINGMKMGFNMLKNQMRRN